MAAFTWPGVQALCFDFSVTVGFKLRFKFALIHQISLFHLAITPTKGGPMAEASNNITTAASIADQVEEDIAD